MEFGKDGEMDLSDSLGDAKLWSGECGVWRHPKQRRRDGGWPMEEGNCRTWFVQKKAKEERFQERTTTKDRGEMRKPTKNVEIFFAGSLSKEYRKEIHDEVQTHFRIFFGIEQMMRKEEMEEQFNKEAKMEVRSRRGKHH